MDKKIRGLVDIKQLLKKYRELISYGFWGILTTILNYGIYFIFTKSFNINYLFSNIIAWLFAVIFAFITNKIFVFQSTLWNFSIVFNELWQFISARLFSVIIETIILYTFVNCLSFRDDILKIFTNILVIIINYVLAKFVIFYNI